jgi:hypothetical protein
MWSSLLGLGARGIAAVAEGAEGEAAAEAAGLRVGQSHSDPTGRTALLKDRLINEHLDMINRLAAQKQKDDDSDDE